MIITDFLQLIRYTKENASYCFTPFRTPSDRVSRTCPLDKCPNHGSIAKIFPLLSTIASINKVHLDYMDHVKRFWYLSPMRAAKVQASLRISAVSPEPWLLAHTSSESRGTFRHKARSLAPLNGWACVVKICHDGMLEDTNSLDAAHIP